MEEDVALANIALDQLGAARLLLTYAGELRALGGDEDALAFLRDDGEFRNCLLVELPNAARLRRATDFGVTMAAVPVGVPAAALRAAGRPSADEQLAGDRRQGPQGVGLPPRPRCTVDGPAGRRHRRSRTGGCRPRSTTLWPYTHELFADDDLTPPGAAGVAPRPSSLRRQWTSTVDAVLAEATLDRPADGWRPSGGRAGRHTEHLSYLLAEMQVLHRAHPGAPLVTRRSARAAAAAVVDPEIRVVTIDELGILRDVDARTHGRVTVTITPTYTGCPAMDVIRADIRRALAAAGHPDAEVRTVLRPAWTTDMITEAGRAKLAAAGIAPPGPAGAGRSRCG